MNYCLISEAWDNKIINNYNDYINDNKPMIKNNNKSQNLLNFNDNENIIEQFNGISSNCNINKNDISKFSNQNIKEAVFNYNNVPQSCNYIINHIKSCIHCQNNLKLLLDNDKLDIINLLYLFINKNKDIIIIILILILILLIINLINNIL